MFLGPKTQLWQCDSVRPGLPSDCGVVLGGVVHAAGHAACGGRHGMVAGKCSGGDRHPVLHHHIILHGLVQCPPSASILCWAALH